MEEREEKNNDMTNGTGGRREELRGGPDENEHEEETQTTFWFPILDILRNVTMKNLPLASLPLFHGMSSKDSDYFLFEFGLPCRSYNYHDEAHKLNLFLSTLKYLARRWPMSLGEHTIFSWDEMKYDFLKKYQDYCIKDINDIFRMQQMQDETLEEHIERFLYNFHVLKR